MLHRNRKRFKMGVAMGSPVPLGKPRPASGPSKAEFAARVHGFAGDVRDFAAEVVGHISFGLALPPKALARLRQNVDNVMVALISELGVPQDVFEAKTGALSPSWLRSAYTLEDRPIVVPREQMDPAAGKDWSAVAVFVNPDLGEPHPVPDQGYSALTIPGVQKVPDH